jgi:hypothetical protein
MELFIGVAPCPHQPGVGWLGRSLSQVRASCTQRCNRARERQTAGKNPTTRAIHVYPVAAVSFSGPAVAPDGER